ncbi:MAG: hypothetical protein IKW95_09750 [Lachnospiraceae bacterium]|nr:hypothetical protein [Lachnospiraceae bacterium]
MDSFFAALKKRNLELKNILKECRRQLAHLPEGRLRIAEKAGKPQYYQSGGEKDVYLHVKNRTIAEQLAQRRYCEKVIRQVEKELKQMESLAAVYQEDILAKVWEEMNPLRRALVQPLDVPDEEYARAWSEVAYVGKEIDETERTFLTERGETVRSKSEKIIADMLALRGVPYRYEYPLKLRGWGTFYPDFLALNVRTREEFIWEHFGMMDNPEYVRKYLKKTRIYEKSGIYPGHNLLCTFETSVEPLDPLMVEALIQRFLL